MRNYIIVIAPSRRRLSKLIENSSGTKHLQIVSRLEQEFPEHKFYTALADNPQPPPKDFLLPHHKKGKPTWVGLWCPLCCCRRDFRFNSYLGVHRCEICRISENNWHVKVYNRFPEKASRPKKSKKKLSDVSQIVVDPKKHKAAMRKARRERRKRERGES